MPCLAVGTPPKAGCFNATDATDDIAGHEACQTIGPKAASGNRGQLLDQGLLTDWPAAGAPYGGATARCNGCIPLIARNLSISSRMELLSICLRALQD